MTKQLFKTFILLTLTIGFLFSSSELFMKKKIQIEDRFRGIGMNPELYKIWIGTKDDANINSKYRIEKKNTRKKEYIPGLPTIPSAPKAVSTPSRVYNESYIVYIYIDNSYNTPALINTMKKIIETDIWPALNHCEDCIQFEALEFYKKEKGSHGENLTTGLSPETEERLLAAERAAKELETKLVELQDANVALERTNELNAYAMAEQEKEMLDEQFADLEEQLNMLQEESETQDSEMKNIKSFRLDYLEEQYKMARVFQDSLLHRYGQKLDNVYDPTEGCMDDRALNYNLKANKQCKNCCRYDKESSLYIVGCMDENSIKYNIAATEPCLDDCCNKCYNNPKTNESGCLDPGASNYDSCYGSADNTICIWASTSSGSGPSSLLWIVVSLLGVLVALSVATIMGNKKKVVYLKPKTKNKKEEGNNSGNNPEESNAPQQTAAPTMPPTAAPVDEGVLQSEIQTQRQSAVAMSAGQKEGANQILKDWLDESKNNEENPKE